MIHVDGSSVKEPGGVGVVIISPDKDILKYRVQLQFPTASSKAEYEAILINLRLARALGIKSLVIKNDSKLIVGQVNHEYEAKKEWMQKYQMLAIQMANHFDKINSIQVPREENSKANKVS